MSYLQREGDVGGKRAGGCRWIGLLFCFVFFSGLIL